MKKKIFKLCPALLLPAVLSAVSCRQEESPRIVNIINFVREIEPRDEGDTRKVLFETTLNQVRLLDSLDLLGTFLLQYDALIDPDYQALMKEQEAKGREVGGWWEITEPHVKDAGIQWRGRFPWDWHANVGFSTGYTPSEREKLADVYMEKFREIFGHYPESVGSWFMDAHTLAYMYDKYGIKASCNCKDQYGTDGYTLWGGYWNQAYYPSRENAYMPAQTAHGQIPVPIFRMLGSDPIHQYDMGVGGNGQGVITLEPVYGNAGSSRSWVERFFRSIFESPALGFNYTQVGQENSFTWPRMKDGLRMQLSLIDRYRKDGKIQVMTLSEAGKWFASRYPLTPPTSVTCTEDTFDGDKKTVWFDSRFYRLNLLWDGGLVRIRDVHLFSGQIPSAYLEEPGTGTSCSYMTLPIVDGFFWSDENFLAGIRIYQEGLDGSAPTEIRFSSMHPKTIGDKAMQVAFETDDGGKLVFLLKENEVAISSKGMKRSWHMVLEAAPSCQIPLELEDKYILSGRQDGFRYGIRLQKGTVSAAEGRFLFTPDAEGKLTVKLL